MRVPRPKDISGFWSGVVCLALGAYGLTRHHADVEIVSAFFVVGAIHIVLSFIVVWRLKGGKPGPGTLRPTGTGRFRGTGWPPSKNSDDYR